jgi:hypothetical protein
MLIAAGEANQRLARVVNDGGDAVGNLGAFFNTGDPVKWPAIGGTETLPTPSGGASGRASDINNQGWIVGAEFDNTNRCDRAAIWRQR